MKHALLRLNVLALASAFACSALLPLSAGAAVSADEAAKLKTTLTPMI